MLEPHARVGLLLANRLVLDRLRSGLNRFATFFALSLLLSFDILDLFSVCELFSDCEVKSVVIVEAPRLVSESIVARSDRGVVRVVWFSSSVVKKNGLMHCSFIPLPQKAAIRSRLPDNSAPAYGLSTTYVMTDF